MRLDKQIRSLHTSRPLPHLHTLASLTR